MIKKTAVVLAVVLAAFLAFVSMQPADFRITRARTLAAPPDVVYAYVNDFHNWPQWSPWEKLDPTMTREIAGAPAGTGATYYWKGNSEVGEGRMTITDTVPAKSVTIRLEFLKPFEATNTTVFEFAPSGTGTNVTWTMSGHNNFVSKVFCVFMNMDKMVGGDFERGLSNLDQATAAKKPAA